MSSTASANALLRVRLDLSSFVDGPGRFRWMSLDRGCVSTVSDVAARLAAEYDCGAAADLVLYLEEPFCLPTWESVDVLRDGDVVKVVRVAEAEQAKGVADVDGGTRVEVASTPHCKRKKRKRDGPAQAQHEEGNSVKKRKKSKESAQSVESSTAAAQRSSSVCSGSKAASTNTASPEKGPIGQSGLKQGVENVAKSLKLPGLSCAEPEQSPKLFSGNDVSIDNAIASDVGNHINDASKHQSVAERAENIDKKEGKRKRKRKRRPKNKNKEEAKAEDKDSDETPESPKVQHTIAESTLQSKVTQETKGSPAKVVANGTSVAEERVLKGPSKEVHRPPLEPSSSIFSCEESLLGSSQTAVSTSAPTRTPVAATPQNCSGPSAEKAEVSTKNDNVKVDDGGGFDKLLSLAQSNCPVVGSRSKTSNGASGSAKQESSGPKYESLADLTTLPKSGSKIAFRALEILEDYSPGLSDFKEAEVIEREGDAVTLWVKRGGAKREGGKFEMQSQEEEGDGDEQNFVKTYKWAELVSPKLLG